MTLSGSYIFTLSLLKNLLQESMMLKENLESSCGIPAIIGPYVYKMQQLIHIKLIVAIIPLNSCGYLDFKEIESAHCILNSILAHKLCKQYGDSVMITK